MDKACRSCLGCNKMELIEWKEPEYCEHSPDPDRQHKPEQMTMDIKIKSNRVKQP